MKYLIKRILYSIPILFFVSLIVFMFIHMIPGDPIRILLGIRATPEQIEHLTQELNLNKPLITQYSIWISDVLKGNLGTSIRSDLPVLELIVSRLPITLSLTTYAMIISIILSIAMGVVAGVKRNTGFDFAVMGIAVIGISIPQFLMGILLILLFSITIGIFPSIGYIGIAESFIGFLKHMTLPALALAIAMTGSITRLTRSQMIEVMGQDYIKTARAKGVKEIRVVLKHALKNSLIPVVTLAGMWFASTLGGTVIIEEIFAIPGVGRLVIQSIFNRDYPVVQGVVLFIAFINIIANLVIDLTYNYLNPRIQLK